MPASDAPRAPVPAPLGRLLAPLYLAELGRRNRAFDRGRNVTRLDRPVISVGNLSVGGTGKTPTVRLLLHALIDAGVRPCVAMRGYKSTHRVESDEAAAHRRAFPGVPVVAQPDRVAGLCELFETEVGRRVDCVVLDDGFQHRRIARDLDVVLIDASRPPFADRVLPAGWLREPPGALVRADVVLITHAELASDDELDALEHAARERAPAALIARSSHAWTSLTVRDDDGDRPEPTDFLHAKRALGVCAVGNPRGFERALTDALGAAPEDLIALPDHDPYRPATLERLLQRARDLRAEVVVTTDKDWSKLESVPDAAWPCPVARPTLAIELGAGGDELLARVVATARANRDTASPDR